MPPETSTTAVPMENDACGVEPYRYWRLQLKAAKVAQVNIAALLVTTSFRPVAVTVLAAEAEAWTLVKVRYHTSNYRPRNGAVIAIPLENWPRLVSPNLHLEFHVIPNSTAYRSLGKVYRAGLVKVVICGSIH